ncbi:MAG: lytic transglycosylase domain-containing protein [Oligoflexia bacterium]|nr:lytic transglycosylase domain-containing protein [Oligoflexia bacterium]
MKYVYIAVILVFSGMLSSCGKGQDFSYYLKQATNAAQDLTGGQNALGENFTGFSPSLEQSKMKEQIPQTSENKAFASNIELAEASIDRQDLKVLIKWINLEKPLEFQGRLRPAENNQFAGLLTETTNQRSDLKIVATCSDSFCAVVSAYLEDKDGHRVGLIIRQEEREIDLQIPEAKLKTLPTQKQQLFSELKKNNKVFVTSTEIFPGKASYKIKSKVLDGLIQGDLKQTNDGAIKANAKGKISNVGNVSLVGNTNNGELVFKISNEVEAKKQDPSWLKKLFSNSKEEDNTETINAYIFLKPRPVTEPKESANQQTQEPPVTEGVPQKTQQQQLQQQVLVPNNLLPNSAHDLTKQILNEANRKELQTYYADWVNKKSANPISIDDISANTSIYRFLALHEKLPIEVVNTDKLNVIKVNSLKQKIKTMVRSLRRNDLPAVISMLSYVESGFYADAKSPMDAVGWWQFITPTAKEYGLIKTNGGLAGNYDMRTDVWASTQAASKYLKYLLEFWDNDIKMALASYNAGQYRMSFQTKSSEPIKRNLQKKLSRDGVPLSEHADMTKDFWVLYYYNAMPAETKKHVPKILSGAIISLNPKAFNIDAQALEPN